MITVPKPQKHNGHWYILPMPPHWEEFQGPYDRKEDAEEDREGLERTINGVQWQMMMSELEEQAEEEWERLQKNSS